MNTNDTTNITRTVVHVAPTSIVLDTNVRTDARLGKQFIASIRENGVMQPVVGYQDEDGTVHVQQGQRRTLAAIEADCQTIPVYLASSPDEAARIITQMIENDQREGFTDAERAEGYEQLSLLGLSAAKIARQVHTPKKQVEQSLSARGTDLGRESLTAGYTIEQAATLADLGTDPETVERLTNAAQRGTFDHEAERIRQAREAEAAAERIREELTAQGITVLDETPWEYYYDGTGKAAPLTALDTTEDQHNTCPGAATVVTPGWRGEANIQHLCLDWHTHGHTNHRAEKPRGPMSEDEKAERKTIIENNKAWRAATTVRQQWLTEFAHRKSAPKDAATFLTTALTHAGYHVEDGMNDRKGLTTSIIGDTWRTAIPTSTAHALVRAVSIALAGYETTYQDVHSWRTPSQNHLLYLQVITAWGYTPSDLEAALLANHEQTDPTAADA